MPPDTAIPIGSQVRLAETADLNSSAVGDQAPSLDNDHEQISDKSEESHTRYELEDAFTGEPQIDIELAGLDALEDGKPGERPAYPFTTYAIKGSPKGRLLLEEIYQAIQNRFPYFATVPGGWKNSVRHTLSLMTCFEKVPRLLTEPGKGSYWTVNDSMPHAKPSRVRVRKRKTREDDDSGSVGTPMSANSMDVLELREPEYHQRSPSYDRPESLPQQHSVYAGRNSGGRQINYSTRGQDLYTYGYSSNCGGSNLYMTGRPSQVQRGTELFLQETWSSHMRPGWSQTSPESETGPSASDTPVSLREVNSANPTDYRLVLMSELEKLRNLIGRREDIDQEWCRLMVERLRGTGLDF
ncbi:Forkhead domain [Ceratobasidium sp. AG-Ba]|nr:Forkhead domain [Ceratobasidium sp. AG-Ba]QRW03903.1 Forkhead domain [Ceratobasidium sp. AG-Ba]